MELYSALILGLIGSLHCAGMCGPLALAIPASGGGGLGFVAGRAIYSAGRIATYCVLGAVFGLAGQALWMAGVQRWLSIALGVALLLGLLLSRRIAPAKPAVKIVEWLKVRMAGLLRQPSWKSLAALGLLNGLLPCGLVYVACAGAAATGGFISGIEYMALFGLGTVPMMMAIGLSGRLIPVSWRLGLRKAIPVSVFLLAGLLILRGMSLGIPYVSPVLGGDAPSCCHK